MVLDSKRLHNRAAFLRCIREFFTGLGFLEVDTPIRQPVIIPEANIESLSSDGWYLQSSPELCMKRLLARQDSNLFQICRCFRKGEKGRLHQEEFMMLEWYRKNADYKQLMLDCQALFVFLQQQLVTTFTKDDGRHDSDFWRLALDKRWGRFTVAEAFSRWAPISLEQAIETDRFEELLVEYVEPQLGRTLPTFLVDYPASMASLARRKLAKPEVAERFELYCKGVEIANGFSELTDVNEQRIRFEAEIGLMLERSQVRLQMPERFLEDLAGLDRAAGIALGLDRLFMLLGGYRQLADAVTFSSDDFF